MEFCCYICYRGHCKFLFYLLTYDNVNTTVWKNIKVSKPSVSKSQTHFNKVFWNINQSSCFISANNFHRQRPSHITFLEKMRELDNTSQSAFLLNYQRIFHFIGTDCKSDVIEQLIPISEDKIYLSHVTYHFINCSKHDIKIKKVPEHNLSSSHSCSIRMNCQILVLL